MGEESEAEPIAPALRFRVRRGMKELDVLLERYLARRLPAAPPGERRCFVALLDQEDPQLWGWLLGGEPPPPEFADVIERIRSHA